jgi:hypothetical protein
MVFAHYMLANRDVQPANSAPGRDIASYQREIQQAQAIGIDGFALNAGGWLKEPRYIKRASEMFEAAFRLGTGFKLMFSADMCCSNESEDIEDMMRRFAGNSRYAGVYFTHNGSFVLTTFSGDHLGSQFWRNLRSDLEHGAHPSTHQAPFAVPYASGVPSSAPMKIELVPAFFWGDELPNQAAVSAGLERYSDIIDGSFYWGIAGVPGLGHFPDQLPSSEAYASALHSEGKIYMAPICFQFWGANAERYYEYGGYAGMRAMWMDAINITHPDWIEIITWNDFIEGTYVSPIDDPARYEKANDLGASAVQPVPLHYFHSHRGATQLLAFFIQWYKTGHQPQIRKDSVSWAYRTQLSDPAPNREPATKIYGPVANVIYVTANLTAPAVLRISIGDTARSIVLPAGSTDVQLPLVAGSAPRFALRRGKLTSMEGAGDDAISSGDGPPDFYYSTGFMHD